MGGGCCLNAAALGVRCGSGGLGRDASDSVCVAAAAAAAAAKVILGPMHES